MHTVNLLVRLVENHQALVYLIIYLGLLFEGDLIVISTGILAHLGALNIWLVLIFVLFGALSKTILGYAFGRYLHKKFNRHSFFNYIKKRVYTFLPRFKERPFWSIFLSKFIIGSNYLVIIFSGYEKIDYKKFLKAEISAICVWAPSLLALGYIFGYTALHITREIWKFSLVVIILFTMFVLFDKLVSWLYELSEEFYDDKKQD